MKQALLGMVLAGGLSGTAMANEWKCHGEGGNEFPLTVYVIGLLSPSMDQPATTQMMVNSDAVGLLKSVNSKKALTGVLWQSTVSGGLMQTYLLESVDGEVSFEFTKTNNSEFPWACGMRVCPRVPLPETDVTGLLSFQGEDYELACEKVNL